ncbi:MAG: glycosyltransferase family 9 protein [Candidatus Acidiferrales bacterium]
MKLSDPSRLLPGLPEGAEILIVRPRSLGDLVLETPAIAAVHAWRPDLRVCVLVEPWCAAALEGNPGVAELILSRGFREDAATLRRRKFPVAFNQHGGPRSALLTAVSRARARVGWEGFQFSSRCNVRVPDSKEFYGTWGVHTVEHRISQFYWCGLPRGPIPSTQVFPQADAMETVARALAGMGIAPGDAYAVIQPGARLAGMRWPAAKFGEIARRLRQAHGIASVVNLGPSDRKIAAEVRREIQGYAAVFDCFNARELIALLAGARLYVGNDSGPAHIAAAANCPSVVLFGLTNPVQWRPWQGVYRVVDTGSTFDWRRGDKCVLVSQKRPIGEIGVDEVRTACEELLAPPPKTNRQI